MKYDINISGSGTLHEIRESLKKLLIDLNNTHAFKESVSDHGQFSGEIHPLVIEIKPEGS